MGAPEGTDRQVITEGRRLEGRIIHPDGSVTAFTAGNINLVLHVAPGGVEEIAPGIHANRPDTLVSAVMELEPDENGVAYTLSYPTSPIRQENHS